MEDILFDDALHRYYDKEGKDYISVTTLIGKYAPEYDTDFWSMFTALKNNNYRVKPVPEKQAIYVSNVLYPLAKLKLDSLFSLWQKEVLIKWNILTEEACIRGNALHNNFEDSINLSKGDVTGATNSGISMAKVKNVSTIHDLDKTTLEAEYPFVYNRLHGYISRGFSIFAEKRVYLKEFYIAGMIDVPLLHGKYFAILDWKTNKDDMHITDGYYRKIKVGGKWIKSNDWVSTDSTLLYPLDHIPSSKFHKYAMQLSLYAYILECWGYKLLDNGLEIIHYPIKGEPVLIKIPYLKNEVELMLRHYKATTLIYQ